MPAHRAYGPVIEKNASGKELTLLAVVRNAARQCSSPLYRFKLTAIADKLDEAITEFMKNPVTTNLQHLNSMWAAAVAAYENRPDEAPPQPPLAGAPEAARLAA